MRLSASRPTASRTCSRPPPRGSRTGSSSGRGSPGPGDGHAQLARGRRVGRCRGDSARSAPAAAQRHGGSSGVMDRAAPTAASSSRRDVERQDAARGEMSPRPRSAAPRPRPRPHGCAGPGAACRLAQPADQRPVERALASARWEPSAGRAIEGVGGQRRDTVEVGRSRGRDSVSEEPVERRPGRAREGRSKRTARTPSRSPVPRSAGRRRPRRPAPARRRVALHRDGDGLERRSTAGVRVRRSSRRRRGQLAGDGERREDGHEDGGVVLRRARRGARPRARVPAPRPGPAADAPQSRRHARRGRALLGAVRAPV